MADEEPETSAALFTCAKCSSRHIMPDVEVIERQGAAALVAVVHANPTATFLKHSAYSTLRARICGDCGYTEFYATEADKLFEAYSKAAR